MARVPVGACGERPGGFHNFFLDSARVCAVPVAKATAAQRGISMESRVNSGKAKFTDSNS